MNEYVELKDLEILHQTDNAVKILTSDGTEHWVPWSQIEDNGENFKNGYVGKMYISKWFAEKEELT